MEALWKQEGKGFCEIRALSGLVQCQLIAFDPQSGIPEEAHPEEIAPQGPGSADERFNISCTDVSHAHVHKDRPRLERLTPGSEVVNQSAWTEAQPFCILVRQRKVRCACIDHGPDWNPAPPWLSHDLLLRALAHRLQEDALCGLSPAVQQRLGDLAARLRRNPELDLAATPRIKPGTRLIRLWRGELHQVEVLEHGFAYRGQRYASLSAIARRITGTRWSGPVFFGLKRRSGQRHG